jgi:hypothetical protein
MHLCLIANQSSAADIMWRSAQLKVNPEVIWAKAVALKVDPQLSFMTPI